MRFPYGCLLCILASACSPLRIAPRDDWHQLELSMHEVQTNLDDLRHDINCFQTEMQILDGRIKYFENALASLKQQDLENQQAKLEQLSTIVHQLEKKWNSAEKGQEKGKEELGNLSSHANETNMALAQFKDRIEELEQELFSQQKRIETVAKGKGSLVAKTKPESVKIYKVRSGDSLQKIAQGHQTTVSKLKQLNGLENDKIVSGQELKIPDSSDS